jgi:hypothetical protein
MVERARRLPVLMPVGNSLTNSSLMFDEPATPMEKLQN